MMSNDITRYSHPMSTPRRAAVYCRISLDAAGTGLGVQRQEDACQAWAQARGWHVTQVYVDNDLSGSKASVRRPAYEAMIKALAAGEHDAVVSWALDRLSRQTRQTLDLMDLCQARGVPIGTCQGDLDLTTPQGRTMATMAARFSQQEVETKAERQRLANSQRLKTGRVYGRKHVIGWLDLACMKVDPVAGNLIIKATADVLKGKSLSDVAQGWNEIEFPTPKGTPWIAASVRQVLVRASNAGIVAHGGIEHRDIKPEWTPLVTREDFDAMRAILASRSVAHLTAKSRSRSRLRLMSGRLAVCGEHGSGMSGHMGKYLCTQPGCFRSMRDVTLDSIAINYTVNRLSWLDADSLLSSTDVARRKVFTDELTTLETERAQIATSDLSLASRLALLGDVDKRESDARNGLTSAQTGSVLVDLLLDLVSPVAWPLVHVEQMATNRATLRTRFDGLSLSQRKMLVGSFARYTVLDGSAGRGSDRVVIEERYPLG